MTVFGIENIEKRKVDGYGGAYSVGNDGSVWRDGSRLQPFGGYVNLSWKGRMDKVKVAYLVARAWVPNLEGRPYVVHKDGDRGNNRASNLAWSERKEKRRARKKVPTGTVTVWRKADWSFVGSWPGVEQACLDLGCDERSVRRQLRGGAKSVKGYVFKNE